MRNQAQQLLANVVKQASRGFACGTGGATQRFAARAGEEVVCVKGAESAPKGVMQVSKRGCSRHVVEDHFVPLRTPSGPQLGIIVCLMLPSYVSSMVAI